MEIKRVALTAAGAFLAIGFATAAEQPEQPAPSTVTSFGSGTGMAADGGAGSASSLAGGFGSPTGNSGAGSQTFGGGFNQQQTTGSGPLATGGSAMGSK
ncbi:MAG: hypothetical protein V4688_00760 [Pseudomonadota bacterium]